MPDRQESILSVRCGNFCQLFICRNQCCVSGHLSGAGRRCGIAGDFSSETTGTDLTAGRDLFGICQKWADGCVTDLVGISDYGGGCVSGRLWIPEEDQKK